MRTRIPVIVLTLMVVTVFDGSASAQQGSGQVTGEMLEGLSWRSIGPAVMGGRATDVEGVPGDPKTVYAAAASGGVWKTTNGGITWRPIFDDQSIASIGDMALEPGNPEVIYVGTGESNFRNTVSFGNGVYKSTDGGATWRHLGLEDTRHISRIVINPLDPQIVYVGAFGHSFGPNEERGVYRSTDGGGTWEKVLYIDSRHGVSDLEIDPRNPNILYAAFWHFERKPWNFTSGSEEGGVFKSVDGGDSWKKLENGLPSLMGRIGVKVAPSNPGVVYVIAESLEGPLFRSDDHGEHFRLASDDNRLVSRGFYYADIRVDPTNENRVFAMAIWLYRSIDGGSKFEQISRGLHSDYHAVWIDPENPDRLWQASDGGVGVSYDGGDSWEFVNLLPLSQFYQIYVDNREPFYYVGGGLQDNCTWYGPSRTRDPAGILNAEWRQVSGGDGFYTIVHPDNPELFLSESQGGRLMRTDMRTREQQYTSPYPINPHTYPAGELKYRFNWNAPIITSPHDPQTVYFAGNVVFRSPDFGLNWEQISPDLTTNDSGKMVSAGGPVFKENTTSEYYCTILSIAESPVEPGIIWVGTDDGNLQLTRDGGENWRNMIREIDGIPRNSTVSHVEPSRASEGRCYVSFDRHMLDDYTPYVFRTDDFGSSWTNISGDLPEYAHVWVVREDPKNPELIYAGTELGLYATYDGGRNWIRLHLENLPTVAVHDIQVHPRENDLILATHGRGIWILDDAAPLQGLSTEVLSGEAYLFPIRRALRFSSRSAHHDLGHKVFRGSNPLSGALITFYLRETPDQDVPFDCVIMDSEGEHIRNLSNLSREAGLNRVVWDLRMSGPRSRQGGDTSRGSRGPRVPPGTYQVRLTVGETTYSRSVEVVIDPAVEVTDDEIREQTEILLTLREMQSQANDALRALDQLKDQIDERRQTVRSYAAEPPRELQSALRAHGEKVVTLLERLTQPASSVWPALDVTPRISQKLSDISRSVDGANAAPTAAQVEYFGEVREEFIEALTNLNAYLTGGAMQLNAMLGRHGIPRILIPGTIEF